MVHERCTWRSPTAPPSVDGGERCHPESPALSGSAYSTTGSVGPRLEPYEVQEPGFARTHRKVPLSGSPKPTSHEARLWSAGSGLPRETDSAATPTATIMPLLVSDRAGGAQPRFALGRPVPEPIPRYSHDRASPSLASDCSGRPACVSPRRRTSRVVHERPTRISPATEDCL